MPDNFEREFRVHELPPNPEGGEREIPGELLTWGDYAELIMQTGAHGDGPWNAFFLLVRPDGDMSSRVYDLDAIRMHSTAGGSSNFRIPTNMAEPRLALSNVAIPFVLHRGENDVLAAIELNGFEAATTHEAMIIARTYFNLMNASFAFGFNVPITFRALHVERVNEREEYGFRLFQPWPEFELQPMNLEGPGGLAARLMLLYAEGLMSNSQAYRFLCFYKIVDHVLSHGWKLRHLRIERFPMATWHEFDDVLPANPIELFDMSVVGKSYKKALDRYKKSQLRNTTAHILATGLSFEPLDPIDASHYRAGAAVLRFIAHHLIRLVTLNVTALAASGASVEEMDLLFYPETKPRRK